MQVEEHAIVTREEWLKRRTGDLVTASIAGALFGLHPYVSRYALWALKCGRISEDPGETPAMQRGRRLEPVALDMVREARPDWEVHAAQTYVRAPELRIGATPDAVIFLPDYPTTRYGICQIKTVAARIFRSSWFEDGELRVPTWIELQALVEAKLMQVNYACVAALVIGEWAELDLYMVDVPIDDDAWEQLLNEAALFAQEVDNRRPPELDAKRDAKLVERLWKPDAKLIDLSGDNELLEEWERYVELGHELKALKEERDAIKAMALAKIGAHEAALLSDDEYLVVKRVHVAEHLVRESNHLRVNKRRALK